MFCRQYISWPADRMLAEGLSQFCTDFLASGAASTLASSQLFHLITAGTHLLLKGDVIFRLKTISEVSSPPPCCFGPVESSPTNRHLCKVLRWFYTVSLTAEFSNNLSQKPSAAPDIITPALSPLFLKPMSASTPPTPPAC